jgi:hypothetical protein
MEFKIPTECIECGWPIEKQGHILCLGCGKHCEPTVINEGDIEQMPEGEVSGVDVKSKCCGVDVKLIDIVTTCSAECHEKVYRKMEEKMGRFFYDVDPEGVLREIPTRDLFEKGGLTMDELRAYPAAKVTAKA